jgi:hypothetical protein
LSIINPIHYQSVSDYLLALAFTIDGDRFIKGSVSIPVSEIVGFTPMTFHNKAKAKGWFDESSTEEHPLYSWGDQFVLTADFSAYYDCLLTWLASDNMEQTIESFLHTLEIEDYVE